MAGRIGSTRPMPMNDTTQASATANTALGCRNGLAAARVVLPVIAKTPFPAIRPRGCDCGVDTVTGSPGRCERLLSPGVGQGVHGRQGRGKCGPVSCAQIRQDRGEPLRP